MSYHHIGLMIQLISLPEEGLLPPDGHGGHCGGCRCCSWVRWCPSTMLYC